MTTPSSGQMDANVSSLSTRQDSTLRRQQKNNTPQDAKKNFSSSSLLMFICVENERVDDLKNPLKVVIFEKLGCKKSISYWLRQTCLKIPKNLKKTKFSTRISTAPPLVDS